VKANAQIESFGSYGVFLLIVAYFNRYRLLNYSTTFLISL